MSETGKNFMELKFSSRSENEAFARVTVASFISQLDPTVEELTEIKTVVSEAVTNAVIHGYEEKEDGVIYIRTDIEGQKSASPFPIRASALKISTKPDNRFTRPNRNWNGRAWDLPSWKISWMK
jgi:anti-sigma F factor